MKPRQYLKLDAKTVKSLEKAINIVLDQNRRQMTQNDMLRLMVVRTELTDMKQEECTE